jgi:hypothetical protein
MNGRRHPFSPRRVLLAALVALVAAGVLTSGAGVSGVADLAARTQPARAASAAPALTDLRGVDELRALFDADRGHLRMVLLLSPT